MIVLTSQGIVVLENQIEVHLATSAVGFAPSEYRGKDIEDWLVELSFYEATQAEINDKLLTASPQPIITKSKTLIPLILQVQRARENIYWRSIQNIETKKITSPIFLDLKKARINNIIWATGF